MLIVFMEKACVETSIWAYLMGEGRGRTGDVVPLQKAKKTSDKHNLLGNSSLQH
jgi:hypothetical protein